ncbi:hypothetical protein WDW37_03230 [Bdellovibrionota bacterium FG-1]
MSSKFLVSLVVVSLGCMSSAFAEDKEPIKPTVKLSAKGLVNVSNNDSVQGGAKVEGSVTVPHEMIGLSADLHVDMGGGAVGQTGVADMHFAIQSPMKDRNFGMQSEMGVDCSAQTCIMGNLTGMRFKVGGGTLQVDGRFPFFGTIVDRTPPKDSTGWTGLTIAGARIGYEKQIHDILAIKAFVEGDLTADVDPNNNYKKFCAEGVGLYGQAGLQANVALLNKRLVLSAEAVAEDYKYKLVATDQSQAEETVNRVGATIGVGAAVVF